MALPASWAELHRRLVYVIADETSVNEWVAQAAETIWGVSAVRGLPRQQRAIAFQKLSGVLLALEDEPYDLAFRIDQRAVVAAAFARYFGGVALAGPPWRCSPWETDLPTRAEFAQSMEF